MLKSAVRALFNCSAARPSLASDRIGTWPRSCGRFAAYGAPLRFLGATMPADSPWNGTTVRVVLLVCSLVLALSHCNRCLFGDASLQRLRSSWPLWLGWQALVVFITWRMAHTLGLLA